MITSHLHRLIFIYLEVQMSVSPVYLTEGDEAIFWQCSQIPNNTR
jgi:hypothetical protein